MLLSGEAGIGKSRLAQVLHEHLAAEPHTRIEWRCSSYAQQSPLHPVIAHLHRLLRWHSDDGPAEKLRTLEGTLAASGLALPEAVPLVAALLSLPLPEHYPPLTLTPQRQRQKTLDVLLAWLLAEAMQQPALFIVEDLHWIDPSTLEFLTLFLDQGPAARILTLLTCRPEFPVPWGFRAHLTPLTLNRLPRPQVPQMIGRITGRKALPPEVVEQIVAKTDGVPLFVEELTKTVLESGLLREGEDHYELTGPLPPLAIPATLHDSLMARLDRLATVKDVAQLGATIGRTFAYALLQAVSSLDASPLQYSLRQLVEAELVYQRGMPPQATYTFKHALIQDAAYQSLLRSTRQQYHQRIAHVLAERFPETAETQPELLAHHYTEAGLSEQAVSYWHQAGQRASERSAYVEATAHLRRGLEVLTTLPETTARAQHELNLQRALGESLLTTQGYAAREVADAYNRARELCQQLGDTTQLAQVLFALWGYALVRGEVRTACELGEQLLRLAQRLHAPALGLEAHWLWGAALSGLGELITARTHLEQNLPLSAPQQDNLRTRRDVTGTRISGLTFTSWTLWCLGYPDQARERMHEALDLAREFAHLFTLAYSQGYAALLYQFCREPPLAQEYAEAVMTLATEQGFPFWAAWGTTVQGWVLAVQEQEDEGSRQLQQGIAVYRATGAAFHLPWLLSLLIEVYGKMGQTEAGLTVVAEALSVVDKTGGHQWEAELYRLEGELLLRQTVPDEKQAETCLYHALDVARRQQAKSLELRTAMSLSRLWQRQYKRTEAHELLAPVYGWFTEGFDTADLQEAKALLEALA